MKRSVVEKTIRLLIAIVFSIPVALAQNRSFTIQVESWPSEANAKSSATRFQAQGLEAYWVKTTVAGQGVRYRVRIGRYPTQAQAKARADQLLSAGKIREFIVAFYDAPASDPVAPDGSKFATSAPNGPGRKSDPPGLSETKAPEAKIDPGSGPERSSRGPNATPAIATPSVAEDPQNVKINNEAWRVVKHGPLIDKNLRSIYFVDSMTGWVAGEAGMAYRTTDGGVNWEPHPLGYAGDISFIYFVDKNRGWMLGRSDEKRSGAGKVESVLFMTANGGRFWTRKPLLNVTSVHFIDAKTGWAVGRNATLLKTTDGGMEWNKVWSIEKLITSPIESSTYNFGFSDIKFTDAKHGWLLGNFYGQARGYIGGVFTTSDGGETWRRVPLTIQTRDNSGRSTPGTLHSAHFADANTGTITGEMYDGEDRFFFALHTRDGGESWKLFRIPSRSTHNSQFLDPARGWTAAFATRPNGDEASAIDTTMLQTGNGGLSWSVDFIARGRRIRGVYFLSPARGWAVGDKGMILSYSASSTDKNAPLSPRRSSVSSPPEGEDKFH